MRITYRKANRAARWTAGAFTLVELLLVLTILAILAGIVLPKMTGNTERARQTAAHTQIAALSTALDAYEVDVGTYPRQLQDLVVKPRDAQSWRGPYLEKVPQDPWQKNYTYVFPGRRNASGARGYDLSTTGPDGSITDPDGKPYANFDAKR
jgi:general secretion pathway protein G